MRIKAFAKINLCLYITGKDKKDGYHYIDSLFDPVTLCDLIDIKPAIGIKVLTKGLKLRIPQEKNIAYRAAMALKEASGTHKGAIITITKRIPDGAGMGGGSSDAAAVLKGLNRLWRLGFTRAKLEKIGAKIGSDVPFFIGCRRARVSGKGERIMASGAGPKFWYVIGIAGNKVSTKEAYAWIDKGGDGGIKRIKTASFLNKILALKKVEKWDFLVYNSFEKQVFERNTEAKRLKELFLSNQPLLAGLSGSGAAVFAAFKERKEAQECLKLAKKSGNARFLALARSV